MKTLLICTDGSHYSQEACRYGVWLAQQAKVAIKVLYVTDLRQFQGPVFADISGSLGVQPYDGMIQQLQEVEEEKAKFIEEQALTIFKAEGLLDRVEFIHQTGLLSDVIEEQGDQADLIVLGKRGENANFAKRHLGSMLERVVRSANVPCLVTSRSFHPIEKVMIAYDGGESSQRALEFMIANPVFRGTSTHIVTVDEGQGDDVATQRLSQAEAIMDKAGFNPIYQLLVGEVGVVIADYVKTTQIDLLIAGAYGHSRIRELLIGSVTTELLRSCPVPVLCFR